MSAIKKGPNGYTLPNDLNLDDISPKNGVRYSPNLHAFLKKNLNWANLARLFRDSEGVEYLGFIDDTDCLSGARLSQVLSYGAKTQVVSFANPGPLTEHESFWTEYVADARCALDRDHTMHFMGSETRWKVVGDERHCQWCGKVTQTLRRWAETKVIHHERWEHSSPAASV